MDKKKVEEYINEALAENAELFLVDLVIGIENKISVIIDGDKGVPLSECIRVSRAVEAQLDREEEDFSIDVATPDIAKPITLQRQYIKNLGRILNVTTENDKYEGTLDQVTDEHVVLRWEAREPKEIGKGKVTVEKSATLTYDEIKETKVKIVFS